MTQRASTNDNTPYANIVSAVKLYAACPFCRSGTDALAIQPAGYPNELFQVRCFDCGASGPTCRTPRLAVRAWNGELDLTDIDVIEDLNRVPPND